MSRRTSQRSPRGAKPETFSNVLAQLLTAQRLYTKMGPKDEPKDYTFLNGTTRALNKAQLKDERERLERQVKDLYKDVKAKPKRKPTVRLGPYNAPASADVRAFFGSLGEARNWAASTLPGAQTLFVTMLNAYASDNDMVSLASSNQEKARRGERLDGRNLGATPEFERVFGGFLRQDNKNPTDFPRTYLTKLAGQLRGPVVAPLTGDQMDTFALAIEKARGDLNAQEAAAIQRDFNRVPYEYEKFKTLLPGDYERLARQVLPGVAGAVTVGQVADVQAAFTVASRNAEVQEKRAKKAKTATDRASKKRASARAAAAARPAAARPAAAVVEPVPTRTRRKRSGSPGTRR